MFPALGWTIVVQIRAAHLETVADFVQHSIRVEWWPAHKFNTEINIPADNSNGIKNFDSQPEHVR